MPNPKNPSFAINGDCTAPGGFPGGDLRQVVRFYSVPETLQFLIRHGYLILERNFRGAGAEIDLVAMDGETLVFVEVKTRRTAQAGMPQEAVNSYKQRHLRRAGEVYAQTHRAYDRPIRFDVVAILEDGGRRHLELLKDAF